MEGDYRAGHSDLLNHAEEISFQDGGQWEQVRVEKKFDTLYIHCNSVLHKKFWMGIFDSMLTKYGAVMVGYAILGLPVFGPNRVAYLESVGNDASRITSDYVRNSSLLINLAKSIGRIVLSYKELQSLAGYTALVYEIKEVLDDLEMGKYTRTMVTGSEKYFDKRNRGKYVIGKDIKFEDVPIVSPNGDVLVEKINFEIKPGMNLFITGPNGCGKSSLFRILGTLWPLFGGTLYKPQEQEIFYIPQRPYLPSGTLRDQIIYPHTRQ